MRESKNGLSSEASADLVCSVPLSARIVVDGSGTMTAEYTYSEISAKVFADYLMQCFGIDIE